MLLDHAQAVAFAYGSSNHIPKGKAEIETNSPKRATVLETWNSFSMPKTLGVHTNEPKVLAESHQHPDPHVLTFGMSTYTQKQ